MQIEVQPVHGWGWTDSSGVAVNVPASFRLEIEIIEPGEPFRAALGHFVTDVVHPLSNTWIFLSQRHVGEDARYNLTAFEGPPILSGQQHLTAARPRFVGFAMAVPAG